MESELQAVRHQCKLLEIEANINENSGELKQAVMKQIAEQIANQKQGKLETIRNLKEINSLPKGEQKIAIQKFVEDLKQKLELLTANKQMMMENEAKMIEECNKNSKEVEKLNRQMQVFIENLIAILKIQGIIDII